MKAALTGEHAAVLDLLSKAGTRRRESLAPAEAAIQPAQSDRESANLVVAACYHC
jgi:hypothetical protein